MLLLDSSYTGLPGNGATSLKGSESLPKAIAIPKGDTEQGTVDDFSTYPNKKSPNLNDPGFCSAEGIIIEPFLSGFEKLTSVLSFIKL